jgi:hypothetical protein
MPLRPLTTQLTETCPPTPPPHHHTHPPTRHRLPPSTSLAVQLVGLLAWPCISLAGVVRALHSASPATAGLATPAFAPAMAQVRGRCKMLDTFKG